MRAQFWHNMHRKETVLSITVAIIVAGTIGGLVSSLIANEFYLPFTDNEAHVFRPGWIGNAVIGAIASVVLWGLYGPLANAIVLGSQATGPLPALRVADLAGAMVTGIGGSRLLGAEVEKKLLSKERSALLQTKTDLATSVTQLTEGRQ
jgi:uncharacterized membrane protein YeaQ/YmgE (transglycosylase-associated protein family)